VGGFSIRGNRLLYVVFFSGDFQVAVAMSVSCRYLFYLAALVEKRESHWGSKDWNKRTPDDMLLILVSQALVDAFGGPVQIVCSKSNLLNLSCFWKRSCAELIHTINQGSKNPLTLVHERSNSSWDLQRHPLVENQSHGLLKNPPIFGWFTHLHPNLSGISLPVMWLITGGYKNLFPVDVPFPMMGPMRKYNLNCS
jgi:hypothetical protein